MQRRLVTLTVSGVLAVVLGIVGWHLPVPYVRLVPGPVTDTLGSAGGHQLITISGHPTSPTKGKIYLVTVGEYGGPGQDIDASEVLAGWWSKSDAVVPERVLYPPQETEQQANQQDANDMAQSQDDAKIAALNYLGYKLTPGSSVVSVESSSSAHGKLDPDDVIVGVDGKPTADADALLAATKAHKVGDTITLDVVRDGQQMQVPVTLHAPSGGSTGPTIGVSVVNGAALPFRIDIDLSNVGGPSAGMAFALGIIDKLSGGNLTGGKIIAGTGTIDDKGNVGAIGGVQQKMAGARHAGATVFLVPEGNCSDAVKSVPKGLRLVSVGTLSGAVHAIEQIRDGGSDVPSCPKS